MPKHDIFVGILVAIITIMLHNLALAVLIGVIISALVFAWESANVFELRNILMRRELLDIWTFVLWFTTAFAEKFDVLNDPSEVIIDLRSKIADMSAIDALNKITERYAKINKSTFKTFKYGLSSTIAQC
jgi:SulP family sulfate permease